MSPRASAMPPAERRTAIVRTALDLIRERGTMPTTREIAEAARIAEGTVFRAFETKERLVDAVVGQAFCPAPFAQDVVTAVDLDTPLRERLVALVGLLQRRFGDIFGVMSALGLTAPPSNLEEHRGCNPVSGHVPVEEQDPDEENPWRPGRVLQFIEPDADQLTCSPADLMKYLRLLTFSASHPGISEGAVLDPQTIVDVVLGGVLTEEARAAAGIPQTSSRKAR